MKNTLLIIPALVIAITVITLPKPESTFSIESLSLTKESKSFTKPLYADGSFLGNDGVAYYSVGQNNYANNDGVTYYYNGQNTYLASDGNTTYNGLGGHTDATVTGGYLSFYSLKRSLNGRSMLPQPRIDFALNSRK